jgi:thiosulfate reductase cytochrome b subunit
VPVASPIQAAKTSRHAGLVRITHWLTFVAFVALLISGGEIVISHPRFYWGEEGNVNTKPLIVLPIPASRDTVPTGYNYVMPDQNGWSRYLHFEAAWVAVLTGLVYFAYGFWSGHFRRRLLPGRDNRTWRAYRDRLLKYLRGNWSDEGDGYSYNVLQQSVYLVVIFVLFPLIIWTGLAMSPSFTTAFPATAALLGGRQSARTIHFVVSCLLLLFLLVHVAMVSLSGFRSRMGAMIVGTSRKSKEVE